MDGLQEEVLVVVEDRAVCPYWMDHWGPAPSGGWSMLEQEEWESHSAFCHRLWDTMKQSVVAGRIPAVALVASNDVSSEAMAIRTELCVMVLQQLVAEGGGSFVLTRGHGNYRRSEQALAALADDLFLEWEGSGAEVTLRLDEAPPVSQTQQAVPDAPAYALSA